MRKILLLLVFVANISIAQDFNNYNFNTQYSDNIMDLLEYETGYLLSGIICNSGNSMNQNHYGAPVLIKLAKSGLPIDTLIPTSFGYSELISTSVYRDGCFYTFGMTNPQNDSVQMVVNRFDTSFNFIEKRIYPKLKAFNFIGFSCTENKTDSTMFIVSDYFDFDSSMVKSVVFNYNFNTLSIDKILRIPSEFNITDLLIQKNKYIIVGNTVPYNKVLIYDSTFNLLSVDTLFIPSTFQNNTLQSRINIEEYQDSSYLCLGRGLIPYPTANPTHIRDAMVLQTLDSNLQVIDMKYWYHDTISRVGLPVRNAFMQNNNNDYFLSSTLYSGFTPNLGLLIVKLDSNFNTIWQKHIVCIAKTIDLYSMLPTDDGGALIMYQEQASLTGAQLRNSKLVKLDSTGGIISILEFKTPITKIAMELFPNPASTYIELNLKNKNQNIINLSILDINGKEILQKHVNSPKTKLDISLFSSGIYIIDGFTSMGNRFSAKFVKE